jgi:hypothetical protein
MTTHDQRTEATPSSEADEVRAAAATAEGRTAQADSSTAAEPSTTQSEAIDSVGAPSAVATDAVTNQTPRRLRVPNRQQLSQNRRWRVLWRRLGCRTVRRPRPDHQRRHRCSPMMS